MDKNILKKFAIESRKDLMQKIESKIKSFYVDETFSKQQNGDVFVLSNDKHTLSLSKEEYDKRELLIKRINELGLKQVIEEAAYTWFNRIVAIRYMEINDYLPLTKDNQSLGIRVLSSKDNNPDPEIMKFTNLTNPELDIDFKKEKYIELKNDNEKFKYILLLLCKKMGKVIPQVFDGITDYIDILIPDNLLNDTGFVNKIITDIPEENYNKVEIIGWLYQYYNQTEKDRVISAKKAYKKNEIPYATQLFTPDWIVKYLVENSLGKYWIEHGGDKKIIKKWEYFISDNLTISDKSIKPTDIKCIDPCSGSGHIMIYMFEVLYQIYESYGYSSQVIVENILKNNLNGLDIDDRAAQLSILSVVLKSREYDKDIFNKEIIKNLKILSIQESVSDSSLINSVYLSDESKEIYKYLEEKFKNAKEIGSLITIENKEYELLLNELTKENNIFSSEIEKNYKPLINIANILKEKYNIVITNPPYMSFSNMSPNLKNYVNKKLNDYKNDLFECFIKRNILLGDEEAYLGYVSPYVWMFTTSYEKFRNELINTTTINSLIQLEYNSFDGAVVPVCTFILKNKIEEGDGVYIRLSDFPGIDIQATKTLYAIKNNCNYKFKINSKKFNDIPENGIAYWLSEKTFELFSEKKMSDYYDCKVGLGTGDNDKFLRMWFELNNDKSEKWVNYNKAGTYRRWYGNDIYMVNWENNGKQIKSYNTSYIRNEKYYFKKQVSWGDISTGLLNARYYDDKYIFDSCAPAIFNEDEKKLKYILGFVNSKICQKFMDILAPTIHYNIGAMTKVPLLVENLDEIVKIVNKNIEISKEEWGFYETSKNFVIHPLVSPRFKKENFKKTFNNFKEYTIENFNKLKNNEEELNSKFISIYGLNDELEKNIESQDISYKIADDLKTIKSLISYFVGCLFGRYSLNEEGLIYAGGIFDESKYKTFKADTDNIIPITDEAYFADDIVARFKEFIELVYGKETLNENLSYIAETLGKKGTETSEDTIRRYFLNDFYNDHCNTYTSRGAGKRPIYWLFDSGKKNGFKALIYMHRYNENTVPKVRLDYLHRVQNTYDKLLNDINYKLTTELSVSDKKIAQNRQADLNAKLQEIKEYDEKIAHIANQRINIDLDDGVTANYAKFADILGKIK